MSYGNRQWIGSIAIALLLCAAALALATYKAKQMKGEPKTRESLPSVSDIQRRLNEIEPESAVRVDGKLGPATQAKWDRLYIEQSARQAWDGFEVDK